MGPSPPGVQAPESPWVRWRLLTLETRMESWGTNGRLGRRRRVGTRRRRRPGGAAGAPAPQGARARSTGRSSGSPSSSAAGSSRCGPGCKQADIDDGDEPGVTTAEASPDQGARAGDPRAAAGERDLEVGVGFLRGGARPPTEVIVGYIDAHRDEFGVEPICRRAAGGSEHATTRPSAAGRPSARARARRGADADPAGAVDGELQGLRGPQALEGRPPGRPRHRPGPGRPADAGAGHRGRRRRRSGSAPPDADPDAAAGTPTW